MASQRTRLHDWAEPLLGGDWGMEDEESGLGGGRGGAHYRTLGVSRTATEAELKKAYRTLALRYHPDKNPDAGDRCGLQRCVRQAGQPSGLYSTRAPSLGRFREISVAYAVVSDPEKRLIYDRYGDQGMQMIDAAGVPAWMLSPMAQGGVACGVLTLLLTVIVCLPIVLILRVDGTITLSWLLVFIPFWLARRRPPSRLRASASPPADPAPCQPCACPPPASRQPRSTHCCVWQCSADPASRHGPRTPRRPT